MVMSTEYKVSEAGTIPAFANHEKSQSEEPRLEPDTSYIQI